MEKEYHEIGKVFEFKGMRLKAVKSETLRCGQCALRNTDFDCNLIACSFTERKDRENVVFVKTDEPLRGGNHIGGANEMIKVSNPTPFAPDTNVANKTFETLKQQLAVLKEVMKTYPGKTIDNIVVQMEAGLAEMKKGEKP